MKYINYLIVFMLIICINSCKTEQNNEQKEPKKEVERISKVYRDNMLNAEYMYHTDSNINKIINYSQDGSIYDSILYIYKSHLVEYRFDYITHNNTIDTSYFAYGENGTLNKIININYYGIKADLIYNEKGQITKVKYSNYKNNWSETFEYNDSGDIVIDKYVTWYLQRIDSIQYDNKENPFLKIGSYNLSAKYLSKHNIIYKKSIYDDHKEKTQSLTRMENEYNENNLPIEILEIDLTKKDTIKYQIEYIKL